jgi:hypothetical protein
VASPCFGWPPIFRTNVRFSYFVIWFLFRIHVSASLTPVINVFCADIHESRCQSMAIAAESETDIVVQGLPGQRLLPEELVRLPPAETWRLERSFSQHNRLHERMRSFTLFNGHFLELRETRGARERRGIFNLAFLDPQPVHHRHFAWRWLAAAMLPLAAGAFCMLQGWLLAGAGVLALSVLLAIQVLRRSRDQLIFVTNLGRAPLFVLDMGLTHRRAAREFADLISERVDGASSLLPSGRERLVAEMAEHRRLHDGGAISARRYDMAKRRLFARFGERPRTG